MLRREKSKYYDLREAVRAAGFVCELITLEVGSRGMLTLVDLETLQEALGIPRKALINIALTIIRTTILEILSDMEQQELMHYLTFLLYLLCKYM